MAAGYPLPPIVSDLLADIGDFEAKLIEAKAMLADFAAQSTETKLSLDAGGMAAEMAAMMARLKAEAAFTPVDIPLDLDWIGAVGEMAASVAAIQALVPRIEIPAEIKVDSTGFLAKIAGLAAAAALLLGRVGGPGGRGPLGFLGAGGGAGIPFTGIAMAGFGTALGLAGFSFEHVLTTALGLIGSLAGAMAGLGVIAAGAFATMAVGMGSDLAVMLEFNQAQKALKEGILKAADATPAQQALAALESGTLTLAQATTLYGQAAAQAQYQTAQLGVATDLLWLHSIGGALTQLSLLKDAIYSVAQVYIPMIAYAAGNNLSVIRTDLQPLFDWLKGPQGIGIFNDLESLFQSNLPSSIDAFDNAIEIVLKLLDYAAHYTDGWTQKIDAFFQRWNTSDGIRKVESDMDAAVRLFHTWAGFFVELGRVIFDIFSQSVGLGASIASSLTVMLTRLDQWIKSTSGRRDLQSLFQAHKQEIMALIQLLPALKPMAEVYIALAVPLTNLITDLANFLNFATHIPGVGPVIAYGLALGFLARQLGLFAVMGALPGIIGGIADAIAGLGAAIGAASAASEGGGVAAFLLALGGVAGVVGALAVAAVAAAVGLAALAEKFPALKGWLALVPVFGGLADIFVKVHDNWGTLVRAFQHPGDVFSSLGRTVHGLLDTIGKDIGGFFSNLGKTVHQGWSAFASDPAYWLGYLIGYFAAWYSSMLSRFAGWIGSWLGRAKDWGRQMIVEADVALGGFLAAIRTWVQNLTTNLGRWLLQTLPVVIQWGKQMASQVADGGALAKFVLAIAEAVRGLPGMFFQVGVSMVVGLIEGILKMKDWAVGQVGSFLHGLVAGANATNKSSSPSLLWAVEVGRPIAQGIALGITQGTGEVLSSLVALSRSMRRGPLLGPGFGFGSLALAGAGGAYGGAVTISVPVTVNVPPTVGTPQAVGQAVQQAIEKEMDKLVRTLRGGAYSLPGQR